MRKFTTTYYKLSSNGKFPEGNGFRLAFISDLHNMEFGPDNTVLKAVIDEAAPDLVIIGGDQIVAKPGENLDPGLSFAERLAEEYQVIYGCGNHEYRLKLYPEQYGDLYEKLRERLKKAGICYLENETADLTISDLPERLFRLANVGISCDSGQPQLRDLPRQLGAYRRRLGLMVVRRLHRVFFTGHPYGVPGHVVCTLHPLSLQAVSRLSNPYT